jgi:two-component system, OmpR family, sensor histidine kinase KdpD
VQKLTTSNKQYLVSFLTVAILSSICFALREYLDYKFTGYILLMAVSVLAIFLGLRAVLLSVLLSVLVLNFFFMQPYYTLHIYSTGEAMLLLMFLIVALVNGALTLRIRKAQHKAQVMEAKWNTMKLYDTLLDSLSHELRTPIATIMGAIGMMQDKQNKLSEEDRSKLLSEMDKASHRLNHQVENLLNMSRLESGHIKLKLDWCDMEELAYKVIYSLTEELADHEVVVSKSDYLPLFRLDYGLMEQILYNLLYNAAQHSPSGTRIEVSIAYADKAHAEAAASQTYTCIIRVEDNGGGFPNRDIENAFDKFFRVDNSVTGGTGLGLSIVKGLTEAQNGTISLENGEAGGARFTLQFASEIMDLKDISNE